MMAFEWDWRKEVRNRAKHGAGFPDAVEVLFDERALTVGEWVGEEERWVTIGLDAFGRVLVVAYTWREYAVRIISARKATRSERRQYESLR